MVGSDNKNWTLMSSHGVVLFYVAANQDSTMRQMADALGLTERRIAALIRDLSEAGMLQVSRIGRRNTYRVDRDASFRHPTLTHVKLARIVDALEESPEPARETAGARAGSMIGALILPALLAVKPLASLPAFV